MMVYAPREKYTPSFPDHVDQCETIFNAALRHTVNNHAYGTPFTPETRAAHLAELNAELVLSHLEHNRAMMPADQDRAVRTYLHLRGRAA